MSHNHCHMSADADATDVACAAATATNQHNQPIGSERASTNNNANNNASSAYGPSPIADRSVATSAESRKNVAALGSMQGFSAPSGGDDTPPPSSGDDRAPSSPKNNKNNNTNNKNGAPPSRSSVETGPPEPGSNLHVSGLPSTVDDAVLTAAFAPHGRVVSAKVMLHVETGVSRGFGFVLFPTAAEAEHARKAMQGVSIDGHGGRLQIALSMHRGENVTAESRVVYVRHVPKAVLGTHVLTGFLATFGTVVKFGIHPDDVKGPTAYRHNQHNPHSQQHGDDLANIVVTFDSIQAARHCVAACHGKTPLPQCRVPLLSKMEEPQTLREQRLREQRIVQQQKAAEVPVADASMIVASVKLPHVPTKVTAAASSRSDSHHRSGAETPSSEGAVSARDEQNPQARRQVQSNTSSRHARQRRPAQSDPRPGQQLPSPQPQPQQQLPYGAPYGGMYAMMPPVPLHPSAAYPAAAQPLPPPSMAPYGGYQPAYYHHHHHHHPAYSHPGAGGYAGGGAAPGMLPFPVAGAPMPGSVPFPATASSPAQAHPSGIWNYFAPGSHPAGYPHPSPAS